MIIQSISINLDDECYHDSIIIVGSKLSNGHYDLDEAERICKDCKKVMPHYIEIYKDPRKVYVGVNILDRNIPRDHIHYSGPVKLIL